MNAARSRISQDREKIYVFKRNCADFGFEYLQDLCCTFRLFAAIWSWALLQEQKRFWTMAIASLLPSQVNLLNLLDELWTILNIRLPLKPPTHPKKTTLSQDVPLYLVPPQPSPIPGEAIRRSIPVHGPAGGPLPPAQPHLCPLLSGYLTYLNPNHLCGGWGSAV